MPDNVFPNFYVDAQPKFWLIIVEVMKIPFLWEISSLLLFHVQSY